MNALCKVCFLSHYLFCFADLLAGFSENHWKSSGGSKSSPPDPFYSLQRLYIEFNLWYASSSYSLSNTELLKKYELYHLDIQQLLPASFKHEKGRGFVQTFILPYEKLSTRPFVLLKLILFSGPRSIISSPETFVVEKKQTRFL